MKNRISDRKFFIESEYKTHFSVVFLYILTFFVYPFLIYQHFVGEGHHVVGFTKHFMKMNEMLCNVGYECKDANQISTH